ncbi:TolB family protein [Marinitoga aeolica]|uniref:Uncharacterized protein n=1 Tax=Marinitoga aeolica TaxID=2809031 RepID=A0ABY8PSQ0_9BACT|nr:hypothetical protein [Marinitoga aeolica]WGS65634.1 hypothetical protein JRV97_03515 [Marinitoga aeolica]
MKRISVILLYIFLITYVFSGEIYNFNKSAFVEKTKYFKFVFEKDLYNYVYELEKLSDKLYENYVEFYETKPGSITVYIFDDVDFVNSFALPPLNVIRLYINPPNAKIGLSENVEEWISFVFSHELNHIFYGNTLNNYVSWIPNNIIRKALMMNWNPSYLHEGLSIYMESKYFKGRFQNNLFNMYLKAEILSNNYPRYQLGAGPYKDIWSPAGFNYMYGAIVTKEISEKYGEDTLRSIIKDINSHLFFSTISSSFERITNEKWNDFLLYIKIKYKNEYLDLLNKGYVDNYVPLNKSNHFTSNLKTDGKNIYYYKESPGKRSGIYRYKDDKLILPDIKNFDISNDGKIIYLISNKNDKYINSLYLKCNCPISDTLIDIRVTNFAFAGSERIVYTKIKDGLTAVFLKNLNTGKTEKLMDYGKYTINDFYYFNNKIYFSGIINNQNDIYYIDLNTKKLIQLTNDKYIEMNLFVKDNNIYYTANYEDDIFNIYSINLITGLVSKLTNHIFGTFYPVVLNDELYFLYYNFTGYHLSKIEINNIGEKNIKLYNTQIIVENTDLKIAKQMNKYSESLKYNFLVPYAENNDIGALYLSLSEGVNYGVGAGLLTDFTQLKPIFGFYLDYYTQNLGIFKYQNSKLYSSINISKSFEFHLKKQNYLTLSSNFELENITLKSKEIIINLMNNPYKIDQQQYYENNSILGYNNDNFYIQYSKAFDIYSVKTEPYIYYDTNGNLIPGLKLSKRIWYPYFSILDGKYSLDGINGSIDYNYNLKTKKSNLKFSLNMDLTALYWINFTLPLIKNN